MVYLFYTTYISVDLTHHEIFRAKVGKSGTIDGLADIGMCTMQNAFIEQVNDINLMTSQHIVGS